MKEEIKNPKIKMGTWGPYKILQNEIFMGFANYYIKIKNWSEPKNLNKKIKLLFFFQTIIIYRDFPVDAGVEGGGGVVEFSGEWPENDSRR